MKNLISIRACIYKSAKVEARIVKAEFLSAVSNITRVELYPLIRLGICTRVIAEYRVFSE